MANDEWREKLEDQMSKISELCARRFRHSGFVIPSDFVIRHSSFGFGSIL